ncbi:dihydrofolate reductase [Blastococcus colisei]|uniref:Dihydrofolate reductase n=2 Tax=Blastococcus colisei TaxID=1564162 RepID=A0A543PB64_9ACTN|nr:dihydrofolate reductase [Blastococcus colisei]
MAELRVHNFSISLDGYGAGPRQDMDDPLGVGGEQLHEWMFAADAPEVDRRYSDRGTEGIGTTIMGRHMFGPVGGSGDPDDEWRGWWGEDPPFHHDVFVLTHHARDPVAMVGGTTFHFVTDGIEAALDRAREAAGGRHVRLGGGVSTVRQYLQAGLLDELHVVVVPVLLGAGERLFGDLGDALGGWTRVEFAPSRSVAHVLLRRGPADFDTMGA